MNCIGRFLKSARPNKQMKGFDPLGPQGILGESLNWHKYFMGEWQFTASLDAQ